MYYLNEFNMQAEIEKMKKEICDEFDNFVCGEDGIAVLNFNEFNKVLNDEFMDFANVSISKPTRGRHAVSGSRRGH